MGLSSLIAIIVMALLWASWRIVHYRRNRNDLRSMRVHLQKLASGQE